MNRIMAGQDMKMVKEDVTTRESDRIPHRAAALFDNRRVVHGTTAVTQGRRYVLTLRSEVALYAPFVPPLL